MKINYLDSQRVNKAIENNEQLKALISYDGSKAYVWCTSDGANGRELLRMFGYSEEDVLKYFQIAFDKDSAEWTSVCPSHYRGINDNLKRIKAFYRDGMNVISEFLSQMNYFCDIKIPINNKLTNRISSEDDNEE